MVNSLNAKCVYAQEGTNKFLESASDLYAPVLKATEARLLLAHAAAELAEGAKVVKTDTKQAYLYGDMGDVVVYIRPPDWWPEPIPEAHVFLLLKSIYGTLQAAR